jgi:hypothetical protein
LPQNTAAASKNDEMSDFPSCSFPTEAVAASENDETSDFPSCSFPTEAVAASNNDETSDFLSCSFPTEAVAASKNDETSDFPSCSSLTKAVAASVMDQTSKLPSCSSPSIALAASSTASPEKGKRNSQKRKASNKARVMAAKQTMTRKNEDPFIDRLVAFSCASWLGATLITAFGDSWFEEARCKLVDKQNGHIVGKVMRQTKVRGKKISRTLPMT